MLRLHGEDRRGEPDASTAEPLYLTSPQHVRVDVNALAASLEPGERLLVVISGGESIPTGPYAPEITVHADGAVPSQLVLPVVQGTFGGAAPNIQYPPRPHALDAPGRARRT